MIWLLQLSVFKAPKARRTQGFRFRRVGLASATVWLGALTGLAANSAEAQTTNQAPPSPAASTSTIPAIWSAQVVSTEDVAKVVNQGPQPAAPDSSTPGVAGPDTSVPTSPSSTTKKSAKARKTKSTTTLVRLLPTTTAGNQAPTAKAPTSAPTRKLKTSTTAVSAAATPTTIVARLVASTDSSGAVAGEQSMDISLAKLRQCESGGRYDLNTGNGYYGAYQFSASTWTRLGFTGLPHQAPPATQDDAARKLQAKSGWGQWPACARKLGLR